MKEKPGINQAKKVLHIVKEAGLIRPRDLSARGISPTHLQRLYEQGLLERSGRGIYLPIDAISTQDENISLAEISVRVSGAVICLLSALRFHGLTTQTPHAVWIALPTTHHVPAIDYPRVHVVRMSEKPFTAGIEEAVVSGTIIRVYNPAKTVADGFKFRNKIGIDVAIEALKDCLRKRKATMNDLWHYAQICRVANVMRPYLESVTAE